MTRWNRFAVIRPCWPLFWSIERKAQGNVFGYGTYMICDDGFRNVLENGRTIGFQLHMRLANYRGYLLSQIEDIRIAVDGQPIPRCDIRFSVGGRTYTLEE